MRKPIVLLLAWIALPCWLVGEVVEVDLLKTPTVYTGEGAICEAGPDENGVGLKIAFNFEESHQAWAQVHLSLPPLGNVLEKVTIVAKGSSVPLTAFAVRDASGKPISFRFGPPSEEDFQTFEIEPAAQPTSQISYPIEKIFLQIKGKPGTKGFLEISKISIESQ